MSTGAAGAAEPDFTLDLDSGGHRALIKDIAFTGDGQYLVSASDDKTIRIWDWESGVTLRTLRGFYGTGNDGKIFAIAVSPDGKTIAAGGYFGAGLGDTPPYGDVRLFDFATGRLKGVLAGPQYVVYDLAFSPDGTYLAAGGQDGFVFVWQQDQAEATGWKAFTRLDADSLHIQQVAFADGGSRIAATTTDNGIRLWDMPSGTELPMPDAEPLRDSPVRALAVSADGALFATGNDDGVVDVWKATDGTLVRAMPRQDYLIGSLTFAAGSERLVASCGYRCADRYRTVVWTVADGVQALEQRGHDGTVYASAQTPDGRLVATAGGTRRVIRLWDPATGEEKHVLEGVGEPVTAVGIDPDGASIAWGTANPCPTRVTCPEVMGELAMKLDLPTATRFFEEPSPLEGDQARYRRAVLRSNGWALAAREGGPDNLDNAILDISRDGQPVTRIENDATNGYLHAAFTLFANGSHLVTGGNDGTLIEYETATGRIAGEFVGGHTGEINAIAISESAGLMVTGSADQTIRLWNLKTRELIVSMFFAGKEFVIWMPQGYYYSSDEGDKLIGWQVNQGRDREGRFIRAGQLKKYLWSPEMVRRAIILKSARQAVLEMRPGVDNELQRLLEKKPPEFDVKLADDQNGVPDGFVAVEITGAEEAGTDVSDFSILSNSRNVGDFAARSISGGGKKAVIQVPVEAGENRITITGVNEYGYLTERSVETLVSKVEEKPRGKLYVVVVGADKYPFLKSDCSGGPCDLRYPVADAGAFLRVLARESAPLYSGMEALVLVNRESLDEDSDLAGAIEKIAGVDAIVEPEADNVSDQIADFLDKPTADDTTIVFVAGHGINIDEDYYFIPSDGRKSAPDKWKRSSLVDWEDIQKAVDRAEGVRFMLLDTCHAANAFNPRLEKDAADARVVVFSATAANSTAAELPELGHGVFTYSVLEGLEGKADTGGDGVRLLGLADFIYREVTRITNERQEPFYYISNMENILLAKP
jgi:uncharacterized caspase-like protein/WD40 repeat protein